LDNHKNLEKVAIYCETNYFQAEDKTQALQETKDYTTRSLASVAYQINTLACQLLHMLNLQTDQLSQMESQINHISQTISIHKEKVARREIGVLTTNKCINSQHKILVPANPERPIKYQRKPIDYSILDDIGHGVKIPQQQNLPRTKRLGSASGIYGETGLFGTNTVGAPTGKPPNPPTLSRHIGPALGTLSRGSKDQYRTPVPIVAPPQVPSNYAANYPQGHPRAQPQSAQPAQQSSQGQDYRRSSNSSYSALPNPMHQQINNQQHLIQQQPQVNINMVHPINQINGSNNSNFNNFTPSTPLPPPPITDDPLPPPPFVHNSIAMPSSLDRAIGAISPPLPSPPALDDFSQASNNDDWVPKEYIEKVIAIFDYNASRNDELSFKENSIIYVIKKNDDGWFEGLMNGITGLFPGNYVRTI